MAKYMLIIIDDRDREWASPEEAQNEMAKMGQFAGELAKKGQVAGGGPLKGIAEAARVRIEGGQPTISDGPFAETKEVIGGYFIIDVADRDEALAVASRCPHAEIGAVEVREVIDMGGPPA